MIIPLPDVREPVAQAVRGFVTQLYAREDLRFTEEGVGIKPEPKVQYR